MEHSDTPSNIREQSSPERGYRAIGATAIVAIILTGLFLVLAATTGDPGQYELSAAQPSAKDTGTSQFSGIGPSPMVLGHLKLRDTVYTTDSIYLELDLSHQRVTVHRRNGETSSFAVSSGNPNISKGMSTPSGLFTVQNMTPMAISKQFNNAKLHHWIGIQGGVGFHGLDGNGYYWNLGLRPSSHGCVRMAREAVSQMYRMVHPGALILSHQGEPARVVAFCDPDDTMRATLIDSASVFNRNLGLARLRSLLNGRVWIDPQPRIVHLARQRLRWGMEVGRADRIPRQSVPAGLSIAAAGDLMTGMNPDVTARPIVIRWLADARREAALVLARRHLEWTKEKEKEPDYGE